MSFDFDPRTNPKLKTILKWILYPAVYLVFFCLFAYWTFPYERLKQRIIAGYNASQANEPEPKRMVIGDATWSWRFPGVVLSDVEIIGPKPEATPASVSPASADKKATDEEASEDGSEEGGEKTAPPARQSIHIEEVYAGVSVLPALFGTVSVDFDLEGFDGSLSGAFTKSDQTVELEVELDDVQAGQLPGVTEALELPLLGRVSGTAAFVIPEGKFADAQGTVDVRIEDLEVGDGKTKIRGLLALPPVKVGTLELVASASDGRLKLEKLEAAGQDLDVNAEGRIRLRDPFTSSLIESANVAFKFSDKYRDKDDTTRSLLGKPGDTFGGAMDLDPQVKRAKGADGFYRWRVSGSLVKPSFRPDSARPGAGGANAPSPRGRRP